MATPRKYTLTPSPFGLFRNIDAAARLVFGLIWDRFKLSEHSITSGDCRWQDVDGEIFCIYSEVELAEHSGLSERTVRRCLNTLRDANLLRWDKTGFKGCNKYYPDLLVIDYFYRKEEKPSTP